MIKLCVEKYCHTCAFFRADVEEPGELGFDEHGHVIAGDDYIIRCLHQERCEHAVRESKKDAYTGN